MPFLGHIAYMVHFMLWIDVCAFVKCMGPVQELDGDNSPKQILTMQLMDAEWVILAMFFVLNFI